MLAAGIPGTKQVVIVLFKIVDTVVDKSGRENSIVLEVFASPLKHIR